MCMMKKMNCRFYALLALEAILFCACKNNKVEVAEMFCEYSEHPICIDTPNPRFVWNYSSLDDKFEQGEYRLRIAVDKYLLNNQSAGNGRFIWDSGVIKSEEPIGRYIGTDKLASHTKYYWQVTVSDKSGNTIVSPIDSFETAKMDQSEWNGVWITDNHDKDFNPAPMLRKSFVVNDSKIQQARLYVSAAAYCKMSINGRPVSASVLNPGYTHYDKRNLYSVFDVISLLESGENVISAVLGNGFYNEIASVATWDFEKARWRNRARMICELQIKYADGSSQIINSDDTWKTTTGPYVQNNIYGGDMYDARLEAKGWEKPGFDDSSWNNAIQVDAPSSLLTSQVMPAIETEREISATSMKNIGDSVYVYNFGINMSGFCRLSIKGEKGTKVTLRHAEIQKADGNIEMGNIDIYYKPLPDMAFQTDTYILNGGEEEFIPDFTYHGFQYVEVKADRPIQLTQESLKAIFIHTAVKPVGRFSCSNDLLNTIWKATNQSYLSNLMSIPTDCPQREKNGWTADAHISMDLGLLNYNGITFYEKWINDFVDNQTAEGRISGIIPSSGWGYDDWIGPVWDAAMFIIPMAIYNYYGDTKSIETIWPVCEKYLAYLAAREDADGTVTYGIGDWVFYDTQTPTDYTTTCYYYLDNLYMSRFARLLGKDGAAYGKKAEALKAFINNHYFDAEKGLYANGSQAAQGVALYLGIVPAEYEQKVADNLSILLKNNQNHLDFGMLGSKTVLRMLTKYGHADQAYELAIQEDSPSWGNWIKRGLTTLAETWKLSPSFKDASLNHVFLGDIDAWMYNALAGINYDEQRPGFKHILIQPHFVKGLDWVKAEYHSIKGLIRSEWKRSGNEVLLNVTIPVNCTATVEVGEKKIELASGEHRLKFLNE